MSSSNPHGSCVTSKTPLPPSLPPPPLPSITDLNSDTNSKTNIPIQNGTSLIYSVDETISKNLKLLTDGLKEEKLVFGGGKKKEIMQEINKVYDELESKDENIPQVRKSRVKFANADPVVEVKIDDELGDDLTSIETSFPTIGTDNLQSGNPKDENYKETDFMCRSKGNEPPKPINLTFPTKTTVVIVDRRKTDNGCQNHLCLKPMVPLVPSPSSNHEDSTSSQVTAPPLPPPPPPPVQPPSPPAPPPPPPSLSLQTKLKVKVNNTKDKEWKDRLSKSNDLITKRQEMFQAINLAFNEYYNDEETKHTIDRKNKVKFASGEVDVKEDTRYEDDLNPDKEDLNMENTKSLSNTSSNEVSNEEKDCSETHYICRSKDTKTPQPINLSFPAKTTVIVVDRRKTDNGSHDFFCSLNVSKEGKQKLNKQRQLEAEKELESLPKKKIDQILNQLGGN